MTIPRWDEPIEPEDLSEPGDGLAARIKALLDPAEFLLWADRPVLPPRLHVRFMPALFTSSMAGLSGLSLAALFGLIGDGWASLPTLALALGLGPCVLGGLLLWHLAIASFRRWRKRRRLAATIYALTDRRAIVACAEARTGWLTATSLRPEDISGTRRFENPDGSGDLFFLGRGIDAWLPIGFLEVPRVERVEALVRDALLDVEDDWWKLGAAGTC